MIICIRKQGLLLFYIINVSLFTNIKILSEEIRLMMHILCSS